MNTLHLSPKLGITISDFDVSTKDPRRNKRRSCFVGEFEKKLKNKSLVCLHKLSFDVTDECCNGIVRYRETGSSERFFVPAMAQWAKRFAASNM